MGFDSGIAIGRSGEYNACIIVKIINLRNKMIIARIKNNLY